MQIDPSIVLACRVVSTLVFGMAALGKLKHFAEFQGVVANYRVVPVRWANAVAYLVVALEIFIAVTIGTGIGMAAGAVCAMALLGIFIGAMSINLARGRKHIDCGCFQSALRQRLSGMLIARNVLLIAAAVPLLIAEPWPSFSMLQVLDGIGAGIVLFVLYHVLDQLLALRDLAARRKRVP